MRVLVLAVLLAGCGGAPAKKAAPQEHPVDRISDLAGRWVTSDEMDWSYEMTIDAKGGIDVWMDRGKMGRCEQKGTIIALADRLARVVYTKGECNPQAVHTPIDMRITSFTGDSLTVEVATQARTYQRAPDSDAGVHTGVQLQH